MNLKGLFLLCGFLSAGPGLSAVNSGIPDYAPTVMLGGELGIFADRDISSEAAMLAEEFKRFQPGIKIVLEPSMTGGVIGDGPRTVKNPLVLMGRRIADRDIAKLQEDSRPIVSAPVFGWGVFFVASEKSPVTTLDLESLGEAYFGQRTKGVTWSEIGAEPVDPNNADQVALHGMSDLSRFTLLFRTLLTTDQKLAPIVTRHRGVQDLLHAVEQSGSALGFCGHGSDKVKFLALSKGRGNPAAPPPSDRVSLEAKNPYPLMSVAMVYASNVERDSAHAEFCRFLMSKEGVRAMEKLEFLIPLSDEDYGKARRDFERQLEAE